MSWLSDTFPRVFGGGQVRSLAKSSGDVLGQIFGDPDAKTDARGILQGIFPWGTPPRRGSRELTLLYSASPWLRAAVGRIATSVAQTHWRLYAVRDNGGRAVRMKSIQYAPKHVRARALRKSGATLPNGTEVEEIFEHPMLDFLAAGNPLLSGHDSLLVSQVHFELCGEFFWLLERWESGPQKGKPKQYWPIPTFWVQMTPTTMFPAYRLQWQGWSVDVPETEIVWSREPDPYFPFGRGVGTAQTIDDELGTDENASKFTNAWFLNRALPAAIVSLDGGSKAEAERIQEDWRQKYAGVLKAFQVHFSSSKVSVAQLQNTFEQMQLIDLRKFERDTILQSFGYPGEILGIIENANRSTIDTAAYRLEKYVIEPRRERLRRLLQDRLCREWDDRIIVDYENEIPEDKEFLLKAAQARPSAFTNNEFRELVGVEATEEDWGEERPPTPTAAPAGPFALGAPEPRRLLPGSKAQEEQDDRASPDWDPSDIPEPENLISAERMAEQLSEIMADAVREFGEQAFGAALEASADGTDASGAFSMRNPAVQEFLKTSADDVTNISTTTRDYLREFLATAYDNGDSIDEMVKALEADDNFAFGDARSENIARTEILGASNAGALEGFKQSGVIDKKVWLATPGTHGSRESHEALDGKVIGIDEEFTDSATGARGQHPGAFGDPASDCNCRCAVSAWVDDPAEEAGQGVTKSKPRGKPLHESHAAIEKMRAPHEKAIRMVAAKVLAEQRSSVIEALRTAKK